MVPGIWILQKVILGLRIAGGGGKGGGAFWDVSQGNNDSIQQECTKNQVQARNYAKD